MVIVQGFPLLYSYRGLLGLKTPYHPHQARLAQERVDAKNAFDGYIHSMRSATEGSGDNKGLSEKMDSDEACTA